MAQWRKLHLVLFSGEGGARVSHWRRADAGARGSGMMRVRWRAQETRGRDGDREESEGSRDRSGSGEGLALPSPCVTALGREMGIEQEALPWR